MDILAYTNLNAPYPYPVEGPTVFSSLHTSSIKRCNIVGTLAFSDIVTVERSSWYEVA